jgi:hypothetical protein
MKRDYRTQLITAKLDRSFQQKKKAIENGVRNGARVKK